jgi:hypothetical protein
MEKTGMRIIGSWLSPLNVKICGWMLGKEWLSVLPEQLNDFGAALRSQHYIMQNMQLAMGNTLAMSLLVKFQGFISYLICWEELQNHCFFLFCQTSSIKKLWNKSFQKLILFPSQVSGETRCWDPQPRQTTKSKLNEYVFETGSISLLRGMGGGRGEVTPIHLCLLVGD